jgi:hypothetical protein
MKRKVIALLLVVSMLLSSACSVVREFVIVNESDGLLEVEYTLKPSGMLPNRQIEMPVLLCADKLSKSEWAWRALPYERYHIDHKSGHVSVRLGPNEVLRVAEVMNYSGHESEHSESKFDIASLRLEGVRGTVKYEGRQALTQFIESDSMYIIRYR